jgi:hypothetical protein
MSDDREKKEDPVEELKQGLGHLWRAARGIATEVKKEATRTDFGKAIDDAGREFVRAAANVVDRIAVEVNELAKPSPPPRGEDAPPVGGAEPKQDEPPAHAGGTEADDEFDGVRPRERPPTAQDPGFRIAVDDAEAKKKPE